MTGIELRSDFQPPCGGIGLPNRICPQNPMPSMGLIWLGPHVPILNCSFNSDVRETLPQWLCIRSFQHVGIHNDLFCFWTCSVVLFFVLVALLFEFRASSLIGRHFYHLSHSFSPFLWWVFSRQGLKYYLPRLASNQYLPDLCLLSS
jgi:hypothetical protein